MKIYHLIVIGMMTITTGCGGGGDAASNQSSGQNGQNSAGVTLSNLARDFPVSENSSFSATGIDQSFICIDQVDEEYYTLVFDPAGSITSPGTAINLPYSTNTNQLNIDVSSVFGAGVSYQHGFHVHAGPLLVGFIGNLTDGINNAALACIAASHRFSDTVPETTTITCDSGSAIVNTFDSFSSETINRFTLEPNHYAQRYFNSILYGSVADETINIGDQVASYSSAMTSTQHGSYLFDQASGEFVMGFMYVDLANSDIELLVFEGLTDGNSVSVELIGDETRDCEFE